MADQEVQENPVQWGPGKTPRGRARPLLSRRRAKPQLSCNFCRQRKLKCDREQPCDSCSKRGVGQSCAYALNVPRHPSGTKKPPSTMQERIQHLEGLVVDLMQQSGQEPVFTPGSSPRPIHYSSLSGATATTSEDFADSPSTTSDCGSMRATTAGASYVDASHWAAILDGIAEIKDHFEKEEETSAADYRASEPDRTDLACPQLLYGCHKLATKEEILAAMPVRPVVDRLVSRYFNSFEMSPAVLHSVQFLKEYEEFWEDPTATPIIWLGLLFTIMCLAAQFQMSRLGPGLQTAEAMSMEQELQSMMETFRQKTIQCLVLGNYAQGGPYVLETLMLHIAAELFIRNDAEIGLWILLGTIVQLAMHMGYHRDPKHFKGMSPFTAEMRKRVWATTVELDLGISAQMGLPRLIKQWHTDTSEPSNLQDTDFDKTTTEMPPSRPETEFTPMLYRLVKARIMNVIGFIWDFAGDVRPHSHTEVTRMETMLQAAYESIPECIKWRSMAHCITDSPRVVMQKLALEIIYHRARIVLHRKYLQYSPTKTQQYAHSRQACLSAALKLLDYQHMIHGETQPFGQLYQDRWKVSSLLNHDFLLATSILCFYLQQTRNDDTQTPMVKTIEESLNRSHDIWIQSSSSSKEAQKAAKALNVILKRHNSTFRSDSDIESGTLLESLSFSIYNRPSDYVQDNIQLPVFDATTPMSWENPARELMGFFPAASPGTTTRWQMMDGEAR